jgi:hypothetical protein
MLQTTDTEQMKNAASCVTANLPMALAVIFAATPASSNIVKPLLPVGTPCLKTRGLPEQFHQTNLLTTCSGNQIRCWGSDADTSATITDGSYPKRYVGNYPAAKQADQSHHLRRKRNCRREAHDQSQRLWLQRQTVSGFKDSEDGCIKCCEWTINL